MSVTTMPDTNGVMILRVYFNKRLMNISTEAAAMQAPNMVDRPPVSPAEMMGYDKREAGALYAKQAAPDKSDTAALDEGGDARCKQCH